MSDALISFGPFAFWMVVTIIPSIKLLRRVGMHPALAALNLLPFLGVIILVWIVAYSQWPKASARERSNGSNLSLRAKRSNLAPPGVCRTRLLRFARNDVQFHNCLLARLAPSTSAPSLSQDTSGSILP
jgi:hypothetical protein